ncbi:MAG: glycerophosphodiester phosphodiesterase family protein [Eubacteriales bacterium]|nr:glycerophosphodiester phosphodiesterase family protein [Eubacteriales bacterium]
MKKSDYIGSVLFFKHLILGIVVILILVPTIIAIREGVSLSSARTELSELNAVVGEMTPGLYDMEVLQKEAPADALSAPEILSGARIVAHGMGATDSVPILNCLEGFVQSYGDGVRVFEADLRMTSDGHVVLRHDWRGKLQEDISETNIPTLAEFLSKPINGQYTPLSFRDLLTLMEQYPDICIITDTKFVNEEEVTHQFRAMLWDAYETGLTYLFDRMVIQVYTPLMYTVVDNLYPFPHYIFTLYYTGFSCTEGDFREKAEFCKENGIMGITMWDYWWSGDYTPIAQENGICVYAHTVNDAESAQSLLGSGISAVYSDSLCPSDLLQ